jgi:hypothetical protein
VRQVGYLLEVYRDVRSPEYKISNVTLAFIHLRIYCLRNKRLISHDECCGNTAVGGKKSMFKSLSVPEKKRL